MASSSASSYRLQPDFVIPALSRDTSFKSLFPTSAPKDLVYNDILKAPAGTSQWMETLADNGTSFRPTNQKFSITLRSRNILENGEAFLCYDASCTASDASAAFFTQGAWNKFSRVRVLAGSIVLFDQIDKNVFESFNYAFCRASNYDTTIGYKQQGIGSIAQRQAWASGNTYAIPLNIPLLTAEQWIMMNNQGIIIEFYLAPASSVVCADGATSLAATFDYIINNPRIRTREVVYPPDLAQSLATLTPVIYPYVNFKSFSTQIVAGSSTFQYVIPCKVQGLIRMIAFTRPSSSVNNPFATDALTTEFSYNNCQQYQLRVDNNFFPPQPIAAGGSAGAEQAYIECMTCMDKAEVARLDVHRDQNNGTHVWKNRDRFIINIEDFTTNRFAICLDLKCTPDNDPNYIPSFDVTPGNVQLILNVNFAPGNPSANQTLYVFMVHDSIVRDRSNNGNYELIE